MSEEKLYAVKNDEGEWLSFDSSHESVWYTNNPTFFNNKSYAEAQAGPYGHVVELVEPKKVVLTKEQAKIVEGARDFDYPASHISNNSYEDEELMMKAYVNGYTVEKPKLFLVKVPHTDDSYFYKIDNDLCNAGDSFSVNFSDDTSRFTEAEIEHYGLQDCEKIWCDSDD